MKYKERLEKFLELQNKNMGFEDISKELDISPSTLRSFLNKRGYRWYSGKYILKEEVVDKDNVNNNKNAIEKSKSINKDAANGSKIKNSKANSTKSSAKIENKKQCNTKAKAKKDRKINLTQDDLDKLCEVYDWYLEVKDNKSIKIKTKKSSKRDIKVEQTNIEELKSTSIRVDKKVWEDFERLCSNSQYTKQEIITQALKDFMKEYKNLL